MTKWFTPTISKINTTYDKLSKVSPIFSGNQSGLYGDFLISKGSSFIQPGVTPVKPIVVSFTTWDDIAIHIGKSRMYGGVGTLTSYSSSQLIAVQIDGHINSVWGIHTTPIVNVAPSIFASIIPPSPNDDPVGYVSLTDIVDSVTPANDEPSTVMGMSMTEQPAETPAPAPVVPTTLPPTINPVASIASTIDPADIVLPPTIVPIVPTIKPVESILPPTIVPLNPIPESTMTEPVQLPPTINANRTISKKSLKVETEILPPVISGSYNFSTIDLSAPMPAVIGSPSSLNKVITPNK
jgi:hypothetical protein